MATYYWVGGSGTWDNTSNTNWSLSSGGAGGAGVPNNTDTVNFDSNSGTAAVVDVTATATCLACTINKSDINLSLSGSPTFAGTLTLTTGTITLNSYTLTTNVFISTNSNTRAIAFGTGNITLTGNAATIWGMATATGFTYTGTPTVNATYSGSTGTRTIQHGLTAGGSETNAISVNVTAGTDTVDVITHLKNVDFTGFAGTLAANNRTIYGNYKISTGMTVGSGFTTTFAGTSGTQQITSNGKTIESSFTFDGVGGTFQLQDAFAIGTARIVTLTNGTLDLNNNTLSCGLFNSNNSNARSIKFGTGNITLTGNAAAVIEMATATNFTYTGTPAVNSTYSGGTGTRTIRFGNTAGATEANSLNINVSSGSDIIVFAGACKNAVFTGFSGTLDNSVRSIYGNLTLSTGMTVTGGTSATTFASASGTQTITSNGRTFDAPINIGSATAFPTVELADALNTGTRNILVVAGTFDTKGYNVTCTFLQTPTASAYQKAIKLNNSTVTVSNGITFYATTNFTFDAGASSIVLTGSSANFILYYGQSYTFYNVSFTSSAATVINLSFPAGMNVAFNNLSFANATTTSYNAVFAGGDITVNGTLTLPTGDSYINRVAFYSLDGSTINAAAISGTLTDVDFRGITVAGPTAPWTGTRLGDGGGNSGITGFETPKTVYWSLAAGGNWDATAWALTSNGTPAVANYPILGDTVIFDDAGLNTSATVTANRPFAVNNLDFSARSNAMTFATGTVQSEINGNFTASSAITFSGNGAQYVGGWSGTSTFTSAGSTISASTRPSSGPSGNFIFADNCIFTAITYIVAGNIDLNGKTISVNQLNFLLPSKKYINLSSAVITITGSGTGAFFNAYGNGAYGATTFSNTCTVNLSSASAKSVSNNNMGDLSGFTFVNTGAGALTFSNLVIPGVTDGQYGIYGDIQTTVRPATINFNAGQTSQFNNFTISGTSGNLVTLASSLAGTKATLIDTSGTNNLSFCSIQDIEATGGATWNAYYANGNLRQTNVTGFNWVYIDPFNVYTLGAAGFADAIRIRGRINISVYGSFVGTVTLQRSMDAVTWTTVDTYTSPEERFGHEPELIYYRVGFPTGGYTSGTAYVRIGRESKAYY